jgi:hypothetical protein
MCIASQRMRCWIWKSMRHLVLKNWCTYLFYIGRVLEFCISAGAVLPTEMRAEHRLTPVHLSKTVSYRLWMTCVRVLCTSQCQDFYCLEFRRTRHVPV